MPQHSEHDTDHGGENATVLPFRTTRRSTQDTWRVERIDTEPMSTQHHDLAITTLATLLTQWRNHHDTTTEKPKKAA